MRECRLRSLGVWFAALTICVLFTSAGFASAPLNDQAMEKISGGCADRCYKTRACNHKPCPYPSGIAYCMTCHTTGGQLDRRCWGTLDGGYCSGSRSDYGCGFVRKILKTCPPSGVCSWEAGDSVEDSEDFCPQYIVTGNSVNCPGELQ